MLAASHAIGENAFISEEVATFLADILLARYPDLVAARYRVSPGALDGPGLVEAIARKRGYLLKVIASTMRRRATRWCTDHREVPSAASASKRPTPARR